MYTSRSPRSKLPAEFSATGSAHPSEVREARLRKHADYQRVYKAARKQFSTSMSWFAANRVHEATQHIHAEGIPGPRVGLTVGKVLGKAHERNRIKRRLREIVRCHLPELPDGVDLILHPKRSVMTMDFVKLKAEVLRIFRQAAAQAGKAGAADTARVAEAPREIS
jgi:ribonuclease P protein component